MNSTPVVVEPRSSNGQNSHACARLENFETSSVAIDFYQQTQEKCTTENAAKKPAPVILAFHALLILCMTSCSTDDTYVEQPGKFRCGGDGFCLTINTPKQFYGAFRDGDRELQFEVAFYHRDIGGILQGALPYCARLMTENGHVISEYGFPCRPEWLDRSNGDIPYGEAEFYANIAKKFNTYMESREAPDGREQQWKKIKSMIYAEATEPHTVIDSPKSSEKLLFKEFNGDIEAAKADDQKRMLALQKQMIRMQAEESENHDGLESTGPSQEALGSSGRLFGGEDKITHATRVFEEGYEFRQKVEIWKQPVKSFFFFGTDTDADHSATRSIIFKRPINTEGPWEKVDKKDTQNHGDGPEEGRMQIARVCDELPITKGYYNFGGECEGAWLTHHVCNDDTAYQIWHAYGEWNVDWFGGEHCLGKLRMQAPPDCSKPWQ